ncbi:MAG: hypothetical protein ACFFFC_00340 [Candidatus Thorarchaeota archaeon]
MLYVKKFASCKDLELFMQDKVLGSILFDVLKKINVRNLTLTFTTPAVTITFPDTADFETVTPAEIQAEAASQSSGRLSLLNPEGDSGRKLRFALLNDGDVFTGGTAAATLGLSAATIGANKLAVADIAEVFYTDGGKSVALVYDA